MPFFLCKRFFLLIVVLGIACLSTSPVEGQETQSAALPERELLTIEERPAFVIMPTDVTETPIPWIMYAPTLGTNLPGTAEDWMFRQFLDAGIAIAGIDVGESYGSPAGRRLYDALHLHVTKELGFANQVCLLARSRGGLMVYGWAADNPDKVRCIAGIYPVCNLSSYPGVERACSAYGMNAVELREALPLHNPVERTRPLAEAKIPIYHIHGNIDRVVPLDDNTQLLADRLREAGHEMQVNIAIDQGHNMWNGFFECQELVDFVIEKSVDR